MFRVTNYAFDSFHRRGRLRTNNLKSVSQACRACLVKSVYVSICSSVNDVQVLSCRMCSRSIHHGFKVCCFSRELMGLEKAFYHFPSYPRWCVMVKVFVEVPDLLFVNRCDESVFTAA